MPEPPCRIGPMRNRRLAHGPGFPPYLVLLRMGFTLPPTLLPERCALTAPFHPYPFQAQPEGHALKGRYVFCGTSRPRDLKPASRTLSGTLPCGVRTFLPRQPPACARTSGSDRPVLLPVFSVSRIRGLPIAKGDSRRDNLDPAEAVAFEQHLDGLHRLIGVRARANDDPPDPNYLIG